MAFDPEKDQVLQKWRCEETGLVISINQYRDGDPKLQIGPRVFVKKDGTESQRKAGRLSLEDLLWFYELIDDVRDELMGLIKPA